MPLSIMTFERGLQNYDLSRFQRVFFLKSGNLILLRRVNGVYTTFDPTNACCFISCISFCFYVFMRM